MKKLTLSSHINIQKVVKELEILKNSVASKLNNQQYLSSDKEVKSLKMLKSDTQDKLKASEDCLEALETLAEMLYS